MRVIQYPKIKEHLVLHKHITESMKILLDKIYDLNIKEF